MAAKTADTATYTDSTGESFPLNTADGIARALSDLSARLDDVATRPAPTGTVDPERFERLEHVLGPFFGRELAEYDAARNKLRETS